MVNVVLPCGSIGTVGGVVTENCSVLGPKIPTFAKVNGTSPTLRIPKVRLAWFPAATGPKSTGSP